MYEAYKDLVEISRDNRKGDNITRSEFESLKRGGHLDEWMDEYDLGFSDLDLNNSGRISSSDGNRLKAGGSSSNVDDDRPNRNSGEMVVVQFGWSDTDISKTKRALTQAGITDTEYKMSNSGYDKGIGIAVVPREEAERFAEQYKGGKTFAHIHKAVSNVNDINDLRISFVVSDSRDVINFGGGAYGALMTDDPANKTSGSNVKGSQTGSDSFWSVSDGNRGSAKMYKEQGAPNGAQYVKMSAEVK